MEKQPPAVFAFNLIYHFAGKISSLSKEKKNFLASLLYASPPCIASNLILLAIDAVSLTALDTHTQFNVVAVTIDWHVDDKDGKINSSERMTFLRKKQMFDEKGNLSRNQERFA